MRRVAEDVFQIALAPRDGVNAYLLGDVVVDAGTAAAGRRLVRALQGHAVGVHALTHAHARYKPLAAARSLHEGDEIESDRTLVCGDVLCNMHLATTARGLREPPAAFTPDPSRNRDSARRLAALEPELVLFGHGPPLRDPTALEEFADALPK